VPAGANNTQTQ